MTDSRQTLYMLVGPYWSGKSMYARGIAGGQPDLTVVSFEDIYQELAAASNAAGRNNLLERVKMTYNERILTSLTNGQSVVADSSNMSESHLRNFINITTSTRFSADAVIIFIDRPLYDKLENCPSRYKKPLIPGDPAGETVLAHSAQNFWSKLERLVTASEDAGARVECRIKTDCPDRQAVLSRTFPT